MHLEIHPDEKVILLQRKHWFIFVAQIFGLALSALIPLVVVPASSWLMPELYDFFGTARSFAVLVFASSAWFMLLWLLLAITFTNHYLDVLVITTKRMIDIDQQNLFARDIATIPCQNIQDIKIEVKGLIATFFNYGDIHIQTAGSHKETLIKGIKDPEHVKDKIMSIYHNVNIRDRS